MTMSNQRQHTYDAATVLKDAGLVAASAAAQVSSADKILDVGDSVLTGSLVIDVSAIEVASNDEVYRIRLEGSNSATFASNIQGLGSMRIGSAGGLGTNHLLSTTGRYEIRFANVQNGVTYRYLRAYTEVGGTIATGINYTAFIAKD
jgi:hypothetical protein